MYLKIKLGLFHHCKIYYPDLNSRAEHCAAQLASSELSAQSGVPSHTER